jgi:hypothetical protein
VRQRNVSGYARTVIPVPDPDDEDAEVPAPFEVPPGAEVDYPKPLAGFEPERGTPAEPEPERPAKRRTKTGAAGDEETGS